VTDSVHLYRVNGNDSYREDERHGVDEHGHDEHPGGDPPGGGFVPRQPDSVGFRGLVIIHIFAALHCAAPTEGGRIQLHPALFRWGLPRSSWHGSRLKSVGMPCAGRNWTRTLRFPGSWRGGSSCHRNRRRQGAPTNNRLPCGFVRERLSGHAGTMPRAVRVEYPGSIYDVMDRGDRRELSGQLRRSGMFIVPASKQNRLKPHRGGMVRSGEGHAAPTELERIIGGTVTINMSLLRSWAWAGLRWICPRIKQ
jgi:hypothetical protein